MSELFVFLLPRVNSVHLVHLQICGQEVDFDKEFGLYEYTLLYVLESISWPVDTDTM